MNNGNETNAGNDARGRLNNLVAVSVAIVSVFLAVTKVKDDNIVQAMMLAKSNAVDTWSEYQSKRIKHHLSELGRNQALALRTVARRDIAELDRQAGDYAGLIARYEAEEEELKRKGALA